MFGGVNTCKILFGAFLGNFCNVFGGFFVEEKRNLLLCRLYRSRSGFSLFHIGKILLSCKVPILAVESIKGNVAFYDV